MDKLLTWCLRIIGGCAFILFNSKASSIEYAAKTYIEAEMKCSDGIQDFCYSASLKEKILSNWSPNTIEYMFIAILGLILLYSAPDVSRALANAYNKLFNRTQ
jgi:hypothetical protein